MARAAANAAESQDRARRLVDQLLALALADEGAPGLPITPLRIDELARAALLRHLARADALGVDLGAAGLDQPVLAQGHLALVEGVLDNLIHNALRYGRRDGVAPAVTVDLDAADEGVTLHVRDTGPGLDPAHAERLAQRWTRGALPVSGLRGSGLGLAIVTRYCELMGARFELARADEGGLTRGCGCLLPPLPAACPPPDDRARDPAQQVTVAAARAFRHPRSRTRCPALWRI